MYTDLTGRKFGKLTVVGEAEPRYIGSQKVRYWICKCDCGKTLEVRGTSLTTKVRPTLSCGCLTVEKSKGRYRDLTGQKFGRVTVIRKLETDKGGKHLPNIWLCRCDCGKYFEVKSTSLGNKPNCIKSCGCLTREIVSKVASETMKKRYSDRMYEYDYEGEHRKVTLREILIENDLYQKNESGEYRYLIYKAVNIVNGKAYVGRTSRLKRRIRQHLSDTVSDGQRFHVEILKFGVHSFRFEAIDFANNWDDAVRKEILWINILKSDDPEFGYNVSGEYSSNNIVVVQLSLDGDFVDKFQSISEAERKTPANNISICLNDPHRSSGGFMWVSEEFYNHLPVGYRYIQSRQHRAKQSDCE